MKKKSRPTKKKSALLKRGNKKAPRPSLRAKRGNPKKSPGRPPPRLRVEKEPDFSPNFIRIGEGDWPKNQNTWQIENILSWNGTGVHAALEKTGKTWWLLELAIATASGIPFLGRFPVHKTGDVLIYSPELDPAEMKGRIAEICGRRGLDSNALHIHIDNRYGLRLELQRHQARIAESVSCFRPALVLFDPLSRCYQGGLNSSKNLTVMTDFLESLSSRYNCAVLIAHHSAKRDRAEDFGGKGCGNLSAFGDSNFKAIPVGEREECRSKLITQQRHGSPITLFLRLDGPPGNRCVVIEENNYFQKEARRISAIERMEKEIIEFIKQNQPCTFNQICETVEGRRITIAYILKALRKINVIMENEEGKWIIPPENEVVPDGHTISSVSQENNEPIPATENQAKPAQALVEKDVLELIN